MTKIRNAHAEYKTILKIVDADSSVLDLGCGSGDLLAMLVHEKNVKAQGIELDDKAIFDCVEKGLSVFQDDIDSGLSEYADNSFDYVILNQCLQQVKKIDFVLREALRVGRNTIIGIPNFAYIKARFQMFFNGRVPVTSSLPYEWYNTPNLHFLSILDFIEFCDKHNICIKEKYFINSKRSIHILPNLFAQTGVFVLKEKSDI